MDLSQQVDQDIRQAMLDKNQAKLRGLRAIKAAILLAKTEKGGSKELSRDKEIAILQKMAKQRSDSISIFEQQNRQDLAQAITATSATSIKDMGKVMGVVTKQVAGRADNSKIAATVKELLS